MVGSGTLLPIVSLSLLFCCVIAVRVGEVDFQNNGDQQSVDDTQISNTSTPSVTVFPNDQIENVMAMAGEDWPEPLKGIIWMDQAGFYGESDTASGAAADAGVSFGDPKYELKNHKLWLSTDGPGWTWFNSEQGYKEFASSRRHGFKYKFVFNDDYSSAQIYPYHGIGLALPRFLGNFRMELQKPAAPGECPPPEGATRAQCSKCAKWVRSTNFLNKDKTYVYYAFEIVDKNGDRVQPYYDKYIEWTNQHSVPDVAAAKAKGVITRIGQPDVTTENSQFIGTVL